MNQIDNVDLANSLEGDIKFCAGCGYESSSEEDICPICNGKMASLQEEADKIDIKKKSDIFDDDVSLDELAEEEAAEGSVEAAQASDEDL